MKIGKISRDISISRFSEDSIAALQTSLISFRCWNRWRWRSIAPQILLRLHEILCISVHFINIQLICPDQACDIIPCRCINHQTCLHKIKIIPTNIVNSVHHISSADSLAIRIRSQNLKNTFLIQTWTTLCSISSDFLHYSEWKLSMSSVWSL